MNTVDSWSELWEQARNGEFNVSVDLIVAVSAHLRRKVMDPFDRDSGHHDLLDSESERDALCEPDTRRKVLLQREQLVEQGTPEFDEGALLLKVLPTVGRATSYRKRSRCIQSPLVFNVDERVAAHVRGSDANHRRASRRAMDEAIANECTVWVTLTVDDLHQSDQFETDVRLFLRRVKERYSRRTGQALKYVAVVVEEPTVRPHVHALISNDVDFAEIQGSWILGPVTSIEVIDQELIPRYVSYMGNNIRHNRTTPSRFIRSRSKLEVDVVELDDDEDEVRVLESRYGAKEAHQIRCTDDDPRVRAFRFPPVTGEGVG